MFCSWNIRGANELIKRGKILAQLKSLNADIIFLQETHLKVQAQTRLKAIWIGQTYNSSYKQLSIICPNNYWFTSSRVMSRPEPVPTGTSP